MMLEDVVLSTVERYFALAPPAVPCFVDEAVAERHEESNGDGAAMLGVLNACHQRSASLHMCSYSTCGVVVSDAL
jgi:hypothetical protein